MRQSNIEKIRNLALRYAVLDYICMPDGEETLNVYERMNQVEDTSKYLDMGDDVIPLCEYENYCVSDLLTLIDDQANSYERFFSEGLIIIADDLKR